MMRKHVRVIVDRRVIEGKEFFLILEENWIIKTCSKIFEGYLLYDTDTGFMFFNWRVVRNEKLSYCTMS